MATIVDKLVARNADANADRLLENLRNVKRMEGIIDYYRVNGASSGEIALAIAEFVKRGEQGLGLEEG